MNEQDKKLEEIRALVEAATGTSWIRKNGQILCRLGSGDLLKLGGGFDANDAEFVAAAPEALTYTLDIIARQAAERKEVCVGCVYKGNHNFYLQHFSENDELRADRDRLAAECKAKDVRIEALESALLNAKEFHGVTISSSVELARFREGGGE